MCLLKKKKPLLFDREEIICKVEDCILFLNGRKTTFLNFGLNKEISDENKQIIDSIDKCLEILKSCSRLVSIMLTPTGPRANVLAEEFKRNLEKIESLLYGNLYNQIYGQMILPLCENLKCSLDALLRC